MADIGTFQLNEADQTFITRFSKYIHHCQITVIAIILWFILGLIRLVLAIIFGYTIDYLMAAVCISAGICLTFILRRSKRLFSIISQMQDHIARLEAKLEQTEQTGSD